MIVFVLLLIGCHFVVYETYSWVLRVGSLQPGGAMGVMAIGFVLGFIVAAVAMLPNRNKRSKEADMDDLFSRTSQATLIRREPQAVPDSGKNPVVASASQSARTVNLSTGAVDTSRADWAIPIDKSRPR